MLTKICKKLIAWHMQVWGHCSSSGENPSTWPGGHCY